MELAAQNNVGSRSARSDIVMNYISIAILLLFFQCVSSPAFTKLGNNAYQSNGSQSDTQAAIDASKVLGTAMILNGSYSWYSKGNDRKAHQSQRIKRRRNYHK